VASDVNDCFIALSCRRWKKQDRLSASVWLVTVKQNTKVVDSGWQRNRGVSSTVASSPKNVLGGWLDGSQLTAKVVSNLLFMFYHYYILYHCTAKLNS